MPTLLHQDGYRFTIYRRDTPPPHAHVKRGDAEATLHLSEPMTVLANEGFTPAELDEIYALMKLRGGTFTHTYWKKYHANNDRTTAEPPPPPPRPLQLHLENDHLTFRLAGGHTLTTPLALHPWLAAATPEQQANYQLGRFSVDWPDLDEGLDMGWLLRQQETA